MGALYVFFELFWEGEYTEQKQRGVKQKLSFEFSSKNHFF